MDHELALLLEFTGAPNGGLADEVRAIRGYASILQRLDEFVDCSNFCRREPDLDCNGLLLHPISPTWPPAGFYRNAHARYVLIYGVNLRIALKTNVQAQQTQALRKFDMPMIKGPQDGTTVSVPMMIVQRRAQDAGIPETTGLSRVFRRNAVWASGAPLMAGDL
jgi:hypothetical protein